MTPQNNWELLGGCIRKLSRWQAADETWMLDTAYDIVKRAARFGLRADRASHRRRRRGRRTLMRKSNDSESLQRRLQRLRRWHDIDHIWLLDTEYQTVNGRPVPVCLCAVDILADRRIEMFFRDGEHPASPFSDYERSCFVGHSLAAEWGVFIALRWELPPNCIDTMFEFASMTIRRRSAIW